MNAPLVLIGSVPRRRGPRRPRARVVLPAALRIGSLLLCLALVACSAPDEHAHPDAPQEQAAPLEPEAPDEPGASQDAPESEMLDLGSLEGRVYTNPDFGIRMTIPEGWTALDAEQQGLARAIDLHVRKDAPRRSFNVLTAFLHGFGVEVLFNPSIQCFVENLRFLPEIGRGSDYVEDSRKALEGSPFAITFSDEVKTRSLDGVEFDVLEASLTTGTGVLIRQRYYAAVLRGHAFACVLAFDDEASEAALEGTIASVRFDREERQDP